jgi:hypothetical protein
MVSSDLELNGGPCVRLAGCEPLAFALLRDPKPLRISTATTLIQRREIRPLCIQCPGSVMLHIAQLSSNVNLWPPSEANGVPCPSWGA